MSSSGMSQATMSETEMRVLDELQQIAGITKALNVEMDKLIKTTAPGGMSNAPRPTVNWGL